MKMQCSCGEIIHDNGNEMPNKGYLRSDQDEEKYQDYLEKEASSLAREYRGLSPEDSQRFLKIALEEFALASVNLERQIYECKKCGRLLIPRPNASAEYLFYKPEGAFRGLLTGKK